MSATPTATRMQVRFWLPDGTVVEYRPGEATEVTESAEFMDTGTGGGAPLWRARDVTIHGVHPIRHAPGYLTDEQRRILSLEAEVASLEAEVERLLALVTSFAGDK